MPRRALIVALFAVVLIVWATAPAGAQTETPTPPPVPTATPPHVSVVDLTDSSHLVIEQKMTFDGLAVFFALMAILAVNVMQWLYALTTRGGK